MSTLARRSAVVLALLFGLVFAVGTGVMFYLKQPTWLAVVFALVVVGVQFAIGPWIIERIYRIRFVEPESVHPELAAWYRQSCAKRNIPAPRFGIIDDGNPNAFTYGHTPGDARVVVTSGLLEMLTPAEAHAVVAHELGHVANRDFIVMTVASAIPIVLYVLYTFTRGRRGGRDSSGGYAALIGIGAYVAYLVSQYVVLLLSRVREYFADEASATITHDPNALSSALVKISYGLVRSAPAPGDAQKQDAFNPSSAAAAMGICSIKAAGGLALAASDASGQFSGDLLVRAMQWDFKNPWAKWFELNSTHPLTGRRIHAMNGIARRMGIAPLYDTDPADQRSVRYTGNLLLELAVLALPVIGGLIGLGIGVGIMASAKTPGAFGLALVGFGAGWLAKIAYAYPKADAARPARIESLIGEVNVSHITPVPCVVEGTIIGRGVPGLFYSSDLVLRDETGFLTLQYRQPFGFLEFLFGWMKAGKFIDRPARVIGWYRRGPRPYIEVQSVEMTDTGRDGVRCWYKTGNVMLASLLIVVGLIVFAVVR